MHAILNTRYGSPDGVELRDIAKPAVPPDGILVRVRAAAANAYDWHMIRGLPYLARISEGYRRPKTHEVGLEAAGIAEEVGPEVTDVRVGDEVFGNRSGSFAEYVAGRAFVVKPVNLSFEEAAAVPVAGTTALQAIRDRGRLQAGQRVLVTGAGGGVGTMAVQIAKALGGHVTAVTSAGKVDLVASLGADEVFRHDEAAALRPARPYDLVIDVAASRPLGALQRALAPDGAIVLVGPGAGNWLGPVLRVGSAVVRSRLGRQRLIPFLSNVDRDDLVVLRELVEAGKLRPVIDRTYPLAEAGAAIARVESGQAAGKVIIEVSRAES